MTNAEEVLLTEAGFLHLQAELDRLSTVERTEIAQRIRRTLEEEGGDLSANGEYNAAKGEQALLEYRIATLEHRLAHARVIEPATTPADVVAFGTRVRLHDLDINETVEYMLVGPAEADPAAFKLSHKAPIGRGILGRRKGDTLEIEVPNGTARYRILDIQPGTHPSNALEHTNPASA